MKTYILFFFISMASACLPGLFTPPGNGGNTGGGGSTATTTAAPSNCQCGKANKVHKIVGGVETEENEYPWQAGLLRSSSPGAPFCGASLISNKEVLTAAHCTATGAANYVVLGEHNVNNANDGQKIVRVCGRADHPNYNSRTEDNDFSVLTLCESVAFTNDIRPVCLPTNTGNSYSNVQSVVSGWGTLSSGGSQPSTLREVTVQTMSNAQCTGSSTAYSSNDITSNMLCASAPGKDSCQGDSGGPLVTESGGSYTLIGVVSWGFGCAQSNAPGVYARVTSQLSWIKGKMTGSVCNA